MHFNVMQNSTLSSRLFGAAANTTGKRLLATMDTVVGLKVANSLPNIVTTAMSTDERSLKTFAGIFIFFVWSTKDVSGAFVWWVVVVLTER